MITYPLQFPGVGDLAALVLVEDNIVGESESPYTFSAQVQEFRGERWRMTVRLNPLTRAAGAPWQAFISSLRGKKGTFLAGDPMAVAPLGSAGGTPRVAFGGQSGSTLVLYGATNSTANWYRAGDYLQVGSGANARLHRNLADVGTTATGVASLDIWPFLKTTPTSGEPIYVNSCVGVFRLADNAHSTEYTGGSQIMQIAFNAKEAS